MEAKRYVEAIAERSGGESAAYKGVACTGRTKLLPRAEGRPGKGIVVQESEDILSGSRMMVHRAKR